MLSAMTRHQYVNDEEGRGHVRLEYQTVYGRLRFVSVMKDAVSVHIVGVLVVPGLGSAT